MIADPDYLEIFRKRVEKLNKIRSNPACLPALKSHYRENPAQFITDWGVTFDPRNVERGLPANIPFILFPRQVEFVEWVLKKWRDRKEGLAEKTRDMGLSWLSVSLAATLCLFHDGI